MCDSFFGVFMKCLVFSDTHGSSAVMKKALSHHPDAEVVFFLGDGLNDADKVAKGHSDKAWIAVRGNCDWSAIFKDRETLKVESITLGGHKIVLTHGDLYCVKYTMGVIKGLAAREGADIMLFGHTHDPLEQYVSDVDHPFYLFNPGTASGHKGSYGIINITDSGVLLSHGYGD